MKKELIIELLQKFEQAAYEYQGVECWSARELQTVFNYIDWRNFLKAIDKAKKSCENTGEAVSNHFVGFKPKQFYVKDPIKNKLCFSCKSSYFRAQIQCTCT